MSSIFAVLDKVFVREFYRSNASFFLVVIGLGAGFMRSVEHIALAMFFTASPLLMMIPVFLWTLYTLKVVRFNIETLQRDENIFLYSFSFLPLRKQIVALVSVLSLQLMPMILYGIFLVLMALQNKLFVTMGMAIGASMLLITLSSVALYRDILHPNTQKNVWRLTQYINTTVTKPFPLFYPEWIARREPLMLIGTKLFSCVMLYAVAQLYKADVYDVRLIGLGTVAAFSANINLAWQLHYFDNAEFAILRNLPLPFAKRFTYFTFILGLLLLPEIGTLVSSFPEQLNNTDLASVLLLGWSIPVLFYGSLYWQHRDQEKIMTLVFFMGIGLFLLILFKVPIALLGALNLTMGTWLWKRNYFSFAYPYVPPALKEF